MKKVVSLILVLAFVVIGLSGCGNSEKETKEPQTSVVENSQNNEQERENIGFNTETYQVPVNAIYIELPASPYHLVEMGYTKAAFIYGEQCISITGNKSSQATTLEQAQNDNIKKYAVGVDNQMHIESLTVAEDEYITINGIEMYRFEGEFNCYNETIIGGQAERTPYTQYAVGYTFIMDGVPCSLIGTVLNRFNDKPDSVKKDVEEKVDALIKTLRSEP